MKRIWFLILPILAVSQIQACLWTEGTTIDGHRRQQGGITSAQILENFISDSPAEKLEAMLASRTRVNTDKFNARETEGVTAVLEGRFGEAIGIFKEIEAALPGKYSTAANLGTALELNGEDESALQWITEGIRRNPNSHDGTEWLHQEILRTKLKLAVDPGYLQHHHVIEVPETVSASTKITVSGVDRTAIEVWDALFYQLSERLIFVKPTDLLVADLLYSFGILEARINVVESAVGILELSRGYGFSNPLMIDLKIKDFESIIRFGTFRRYGFYASGVSAFLLFLVFAHRKRWFFLSEKSYRQYLKKKSQIQAA